MQNQITAQIGQRLEPLADTEKGGTCYRHAPNVIKLREIFNKQHSIFNTQLKKAWVFSDEY